MIRWLIVVGSLLLSLPLHAQTDPVRIDGVHTDLAIEFVNGAWRPQARIVGGTAYHPRDAILVANSTTMTSRPAGSQWDFIGVPAGQPYWRLSQTQITGQLYLGMSSAQMGPPPQGDYANWQPVVNGETFAEGRWLGLRVVGMEAPTGGHFSVWQDDQLTGEPFVFARTDNGINSSQDVLYGLIGSHLHFNWAFSQAGTYRIDFDPITYYTVGSDTFALVGDPNHPQEPSPFRFTFEVQPVPEPTGILAVSVIAGLGVHRLRRRLRRSRTQSE